MVDFFKFFIREENIAGISIFDSRIELMFLRSDINKKKFSVEYFATVNLPNGVIEKGAVKNEEKFSLALKSLIQDVKARKIKVSSFVLSIAGNSVYCDNFLFPSTLSDRQIDESLKLNSVFSLPVSLNDVYMDWESVSSLTTHKREVILCVSDKVLINKYLDIFAKTKIVTIALETHVISALRVADLPKNESAFLIAIFSDNNIEFAVVENSVIRFTQSLHLSESVLPSNGESSDLDGIIIDRFWRIMDFYNSEKNKKDFLSQIFLFGDFKKLEYYKKILSEKIINKELKIEIAKLLPIFADKITVEDSNFYILTFGTAFRGLIPRSSDSIISLLPIGTEQAYENKRLTSFLNFTYDLILASSLFFIILFGATWFLVNILFDNIGETLNKQNVLPTELVSLKDKANNFNNILDQSIILEETSPKWPEFLLKLHNLMNITGVSVNRLEVMSGGEGVNISGNALTRDVLLQFKGVLENSNLFVEVKFPLSYLEQKENIVFNLSLKLKDKSVLYVK